MNFVRLLWIAGMAWLPALALCAQTSSTGVLFDFREPGAATYRVEIPVGARLASLQTNDWLKARPEDGSTNDVFLGSRIVLQLAPDLKLSDLLENRPLQASRTIGTQHFIVQAPDAWTALLQAEALAKVPGVLASYPVSQRPKQLHSRYAKKPNDSYFDLLWYLENRDTNGTPVGPDMNVRAAWPVTRGEGVTIAIGDDGVELAHRDLAARVNHTNHFNFHTGTTNGNPVHSSQNHGTAVAGLAGATLDNNRGVAGVAPGAQLASWVVFNFSGSQDVLTSDERVMDMYQYRSNVVSVQNHSWGNGGVSQIGPRQLEMIGLSNAITFGRGGLGSIMVRAAGNNRVNGGNASDDLYPSDPRVIAVASVRSDGRATRYSNPGASLLVAAPSAEGNQGGGIDGTFPSLRTTDRSGTAGYNFLNYVDEPDLNDYVYGGFGFSGTSGSAPLVSGVAALVLSVNPNLSYRDVQQLLIFSSRQSDLADPDLTTNAAGFGISHNTGFGVPDAGHAVQLAAAWPTRPALVTVTKSQTGPIAIPDAGLATLLSSNDVVRPMYCYPSLGLHPDSPTPKLELVDVGLALTAITANLTGKAALIRRGETNFIDKINFAAQAGASFAVIYNNIDSNLVLMGETDFARIPAVFIGKPDGESIRDALARGTSQLAQVQLTPAVINFNISDTLLCEHVGVRIRTDHAARADVRITLVSPRGTRSVLQRLNADLAAGPSDWTYYSTRHFYEPSYGNWRLEVSDETALRTGSVLSADLTIRGVAMTDTDNNGLDDTWEMARFGSLGNSATADPDLDGYSNIREWILGTDPLVAEIPFHLDLSTYDTRLTRLSWPSSTNYTYEVFAIDQLGNPPVSVTNILGKFPETEVFVNYTNATQRFFRIQRSQPTTPP